MCFGTLLTQVGNGYSCYLSDTVWNYTAKLEEGRLCHHLSSHRCLGGRLTLPRSAPWNIHTTAFSIPKSWKQTKCSWGGRRCALLSRHVVINRSKENQQGHSDEVAVPHSVGWRERKFHRISIYTEFKSHRMNRISNMCSKTNCKGWSPDPKGPLVCRGDLGSGDPRGHLRTVPYVLCGAGKFYFHYV